MAKEIEQMVYQEVNYCGPILHFQGTRSGSKEDTDYVSNFCSHKAKTTLVLLRLIGYYSYEFLDIRK